MSQADVSTGSAPQRVFQEAVKKGNTKELHSLLQNMTNCEFNVNSFGPEGQTALHQSVIDGNLELVKLLVKFGADIRLANREGWSALHIAAFGGHQDIVLYLITKAKYSSGARWEAPEAPPGKHAKTGLYKTCVSSFPMPNCIEKKTATSLLPTNQTGDGVSLSLFLLRTTRRDSNLTEYTYIMKNRNAFCVSVCVQSALVLKLCFSWMCKMIRLGRAASYRRQGGCVKRIYSEGWGEVLTCAGGVTRIA